MHEATIRIPEAVSVDVSIGNSKIRQLANRSFTVKARICDSSVSGFWEASTPLSGVFEKILIKKPRSRGIAPSDRCTLRLKTQCTLESIDENTDFVWLNNPLSENETLPNEVLANWRGVLSLKREQVDAGVSGFRPPQLGALHAIAAQNSVEPADSSIVVLPTGTGKTETILAAVVYHRWEKTLVLVPSIALRNQLAAKLETLGILPQVGLVPSDVLLPRVGVLGGAIPDIATANRLIDESNICIVIPTALNVCEASVRDHFLDRFSALVVDESHHIASRTWSEVKVKFDGKAVTQFTATPFRSDGKSLGGRIIYNYQMGQAQRDGYFRSIRLHTIEEYYEPDQDRAIATEALNILRDDLDRGLDHVLMARVEKKSRCPGVEAIYIELAPEFNPLVVHSGMSKRALAKAIECLNSGDCRVIICVKMLGEGFDLPNLKIAAIHDSHKSLPVTLQFIGRFTRSAVNVGDAAAVVNIAVPAVESALVDLYSQGADWDTILRRLSEDTIDRQVALQTVVDELKTHGDLHEHLSLWNLRPTLSATVFRCADKAWVPHRFMTALSEDIQYWYAISEESHLLVVVAVNSNAVRWGDYQDLEDHSYELLLAYRDVEQNALFLNSTDYDFFRANGVAEAITGGSAEPLTTEHIYKIFDGVELPLVRNLGAARVGAISFTQYFGPNVTDGLAEIEKSESSLSNIGAFGYEAGERVVWGCSQKKGKIWTGRRGTISEWVDWCDLAWAKVTSDKVVSENITEGFLRPESISGRYPNAPIAATWGEHLLQANENQAIVYFGDEAAPIYEVGLRIVDPDDEGPISIEISTDNFSSVYELSIDEGLETGYQYKLTSGEPVRIARSKKNILSFEDYMVRDPIHIRYVDGCFSYNRYLIRVDDTATEYSAENLETISFEGIDIRKESMGMEREKATVQYRSFQEIEDDYEIIIDDDGCGEAADLVALRTLEGGSIELCLVHCKFSSNSKTGSRKGDFYVVCGQCHSSVRWKHRGLASLVSRLLKRNKIWRDKGFSRFLKGTEKDLDRMKKMARTCPLRLVVYLVQPGLSKQAVSADVLHLLGSTEHYLRKTADAELRVICSD